MPARNPRVNVVLERPVYDVVKRLARRERISLSLKVRDLVRQALETEEDEALISLAQTRERTFDRRTAVSHKQVWAAGRTRR